MRLSLSSVDNMVKIMHFYKTFVCVYDKILRTYKIALSSCLFKNCVTKTYGGCGGMALTFLMSALKEASCTGRFTSGETDSWGKKKKKKKKKRRRKKEGKAIPVTGREGP
jgi:hypothetical protein